MLRTGGGTRIFPEGAFEEKKKTPGALRDLWLASPRC